MTAKKTLKRKPATKKASADLQALKELKAAVRKVRNLELVEPRGGAKDHHV